MRDRLARFAALGITVRIERDDDCRPCREIARGTYAPSDAPPLPCPTCGKRHTPCMCEYRPILPD